MEAPDTVPSPFYDVFSVHSRESCEKFDVQLAAEL